MPFITPLVRPLPGAPAIALPGAPIFPPGPISGSGFLLEDGASFWLLEDGTSFWLLEG